MQYDIEEFHLSIFEDLLNGGIYYARTFVEIRSNEEETIMHCQKSLLFNNSDIWIKKEVNNDFDVTMDSLDGAEICKLVDICILYILSTKYGRNLNGIYRDDGLARFEKC